MEIGLLRLIPDFTEAITQDMPGSHHQFRSIHYKIQTRLSNIDFRSIGVAKPIRINTGRLVPELKLLDLNAIQVKSFRVNPTGNHRFKDLSYR